MIPLSVWVNCNKICPQVDQLCPSVEKSNRISRERGQPQFMPMLVSTERYVFDRKRGASEKNDRGMKTRRKVP